jgi:GNAT superfamily N-acetyltransferase
MSGLRDNPPALQATEPAGLLWSWQRGGPLVPLPPLDGLRVTCPTEIGVLQRLSGLSACEIDERLSTSHRPFLAWLDETPVAYGWSASGRAQFGRPPISFAVPPGHRYLMDFATLPAWRGRGIYPRLLQAILARESADAGQFWILHQRDNRASARGIEKAGFVRVAEIWFLARGGLCLVGSGAAGERGARLLGLPIVPPI